MNALTIPKNVEPLLLYLFNAREKDARTLETLHRRDQEGSNCDETLCWLIEHNYVTLNTLGEIDLTFSGLKRAESLRSHFDVPNVKSLPPVSALPSIHDHPLRAAHQRQSENDPVLRYLLAFVRPKNALPVPLMDEDILGRAPDSDIRICSDEYISGHQCSFRIAQKKKQLTLSVQDLDSLNGTYVNENRLEPKNWHQLEAGDSIRVGVTILIVTPIPF